MALEYNSLKEFEKEPGEYRNQLIKSRMVEVKPYSLSGRCIEAGLFTGGLLVGPLTVIISGFFFPDILKEYAGYIVTGACFAPVIGAFIGDALGSYLEKRAAKRGIFYERDNSL